MSNKKKVTMPLTQFINYIDQQEKERKQSQRVASRPSRSNRTGGNAGARPTGRLSDRLKARRNNQDGGESRRDRRIKRNEVQTAARVVSKKATAPKLDIESQQMFPALSDPVAQSSTTPSPTPTAISTGCWAQGIQTIIDAKDLPDPVEVERQRRQEAFLQYKKRLQEERDRPYYSDEEYSEDYYSEEEQYQQDNYEEGPLDQEGEEESGEWDEVL